MKIIVEKCVDYFLLLLNDHIIIVNDCRNNVTVASERKMKYHYNILHPAIFC